MAPLGLIGFGKARGQGVHAPAHESGDRPGTPLGKPRLLPSILFCRAGESGIDESALRPFGLRLFVDVACAQV
jgi:hypothetical protein